MDPEGMDCGARFTQRGSLLSAGDAGSFCPRTVRGGESGRARPGAGARAGLERVRARIGPGASVGSGRVARERLHAVRQAITGGPPERCDGARGDPAAQELFCGQ